MKIRALLPLKETFKKEKNALRRKLDKLGALARSTKLHNDQADISNLKETSIETLRLLVLLAQKETAWLLINSLDCHYFWKQVCIDCSRHKRVQVQRRRRCLLSTWSDINPFYSKNANICQFALVGSRNWMNSLNIGYVSLPSLFLSNLVNAGLTKSTVRL